MATRPEWITDIRFFSLEKSGNGPEARGSFTVAGTVYINFVIWANAGGGFQVQLPRTANPKFDEAQPVSKTNKRWFDEVGCSSGEVREEITRCLVDHLIEERQNQGGGPGGGSSGMDVIPF